MMRAFLSVLRLTHTVMTRTHQKFKVLEEMRNLHSHLIGVAALTCLCGILDLIGVLILYAHHNSIHQPVPHPHPAPAPPLLPPLR